MRFDPGALREALGSIPIGTWSLASDVAETKVHHGYRRACLVNAGVWDPAAEAFRFVLDEFAPVFTAWVSWIEPGGYILPHRDAGPWRERWQVPLLAAGEFHADQTTTPQDGVAFRVRHWERHSVTNDTDHRRVHVVIDRDVWVDEPALPFEVFA